MISSIEEQVRRFHRWDTLRMLWTWSSLRSVRQCSQGRISKEQPVRLGNSDGIPSVRGLQSCGNLHACPRCSPKVRAGRADEIRRAVRRNEAEGGTELFGTFTVPHEQGMPLKAVLAAVTGTWTDLTESRLPRRWKRDYGFRGAIRAMEPTHGSAGWHPHLHCLFLFDRPLTPIERACFEAEMADAWLDGVVRRGWRRPSRAHGVLIEDVVVGQGDLGCYVTKMSGGHIDAELARADRKRGRWHNRTPFQILEDLNTWGDRKDLDLWWEYEQATFRKNALTWSHGLKNALAIEKRTDLDIVQDSTGHVDQLLVYGPAWLRLCRAGCAPALMSAASQLDRSWAGLILSFAGVEEHWVKWVADLPGKPPD